MKLNRFILISVFFLLLSHFALAAGEDQPANNDFFDYIPVQDREDAYDDESFMYYNKDFGVSFGAGNEVFSGGLATVFGSALPIFDARLISFSDTQSALQFGGTGASHQGWTAANGAMSLRVIRLYVDYKYYFRLGGALQDTSTKSWEVSSPSPYFSVGVNYLDLDIKYHNVNNEEERRITTWKLPVLGKVPVPLAPAFALGADFSLKPRKSIS